MTKSTSSPVSMFAIAMAVSIFFGACLFVGPPASASGGLAAPGGKVILTLSGKISNTNAGDSARFDRDMLEALGMREIKTSTPWTEGVTTFEGVLVEDVLAAAGASGGEIRATAINDYAVNISVSDFIKYGVILALKVNGKYIGVREKGPLWVIYPLDDHPELKETAIFERLIWQLDRIIVK